MPKQMKLPNGFGNINKLSGNRRNPFRARVAVGYLDDGKRIWQTIGYYAKYKEALQALADYHRDPFSLGGDITFAELYEQWAREKFEKISSSNATGYKACFSHCAQLHDMPLKHIKLHDMQEVIRNCHRGYQTLKKIKSFLSQLYDYAIMHDMISREYDKTEYIDVGKKTESKKHYKFKTDEVEALWKWSKNNEYVQMILMMIYNGARPGEFFSVKKKDVNLEQRYFEVRDGKNEFAKRRVPIHHKTLPFYMEWMKKPGENLITKHNGTGFDLQSGHAQFIESYWEPVLRDVGILTYKDPDGEEHNHLPHDTRHTFTSMWKEKKLDETFRRKIQGHSGKGIGEQVYTHIDMEKLIEEIDKL